MLPYMTCTRLIAAIAIVTSVTTWTTSANASHDGFPADGPWRVGVSGLTDFPIQVGGEVHLEMPERVRLHTSLGVLPGPYLDAIHAVSKAFNWYGDDTAALISAALQDALVWRIKAGWRPIAEHGFYFSTGYTLAALGGGLGGADLIEIATGQTLPPQVGAGRDLISPRQSTWSTWSWAGSSYSSRAYCCDSRSGARSPQTLWRALSPPGTWPTWPPTMSTPSAEQVRCTLKRPSRPMSIR